MNKILNLTGLSLIILSFYLYFNVLGDTSNNDFWYDRYYIITDKVKDSEPYKSGTINKYYIKFYYVDNPKMTYFKQVNISDYNLKSLNTSYLTKCIRDQSEYDKLSTIILVISLVGAILLSIGLARTLML